MPNMDDISFFESSSYAHRGGIWADACRKIRATLNMLQPVIPSALNTDMQGHPTLSQNGAIPMEGLAATEPHDQSLTSADTQSSKEASTVDGLTNGATPSGNRRRSWFSGPNADDAPVLVDQSLDSNDDQLANEDVRGRTSHPKVASTGTRSSRSKGMTDVKMTDLGQGTEDDAQPHLSRRSSRQSQRDPYSSDFEDSTKSRSNPSVPMPRRTSDAASTISSSSSPPRASSFLSTLRTRDRQAIKDSAKEMVHKLGVNWGLRKDWNVITTSREPATDNSRATKDGSSSMVHASYADVRAAVVERKEREKTSTRDATAPGTTGNEISDVPDTSSKDAMGSSSLSLPPRTPEQTRRSLSRGRTVTEIDDAPAESPLTPILVQPQAKTMTIPGIHASHRGEVMALGYVAPPPVPDKNKNSSFYHRLLKTPVLTDSESSQVPIDAISGTLGTDDDTPAGPTTGVATSQTRPMAPPLPPRSLPASISKPATNADAQISTSKDDDLPMLPQGEEERPELSFPEKPEDKHKDSPVPEPRVLPAVASLTSTPTPPPLPPRRIQTSA